MGKHNVDEVPAVNEAAAADVSKATEVNHTLHVTWDPATGTFQVQLQAGIQNKPSRVSPLNSVCILV